MGEKFDPLRHRFPVLATGALLVVIEHGPPEHLAVDATLRFPLCEDRPHHAHPPFVILEQRIVRVAQAAHLLVVAAAVGGSQHFVFAAAQGVLVFGFFN